MPTRWTALIKKVDLDKLESIKTLPRGVARLAGNTLGDWLATNPRALDTIDVPRLRAVAEALQQHGGRAVLLVRTSKDDAVERALQLLKVTQPKRLLEMRTAAMREHVEQQQDETGEAQAQLSPRAMPRSRTRADSQTRQLWTERKRYQRARRAILAKHRNLLETKSRQPEAPGVNRWTLRPSVQARLRQQKPSLSKLDASIRMERGGDRGRAGGLTHGRRTPPLHAIRQLLSQLPAAARPDRHQEA